MPRIVGVRSVMCQVSVIDVASSVLAYCLAAMMSAMEVSGRMKKVIHHRGSNVMVDWW